MATGKYIKTLKLNKNRNIFHFSTSLRRSSSSSAAAAAAMGGSSNQKKSSSGSSSFSFFSMFRGKPRRDQYDMKDDFVKAYKVWPSDEDRGRWVAEPGIDKKASAFISSRKEGWKSTVEVAN